MLFEDLLDTMVSMFESTKDVAENSLCFVVGKATHPPQDVAHAFLPARIERPGDNPPFVPDERTGSRSTVSRLVVVLENALRINQSSTQATKWPSTR